MSPARRAACALGLALLTSSPATAIAGNDQSYLLSNEAAMTGGAVSARAHDAGAAYYNPAGLAASTRNELDLSGTIYMLRLRSITPIVSAQVPNGEVVEEDATTTTINSVPTSFVASRQLSDTVGLALGIFVPEQDSVAFSSFVAGNSGPAEFQGYTEIVLATTRTHIGPHLGVDLNDQLRLGLAVHGVYYVLEQRVRLLMDLRDSGGMGSATFQRAGTARVQSFGLQGIAGVQGNIPYGGSAETADGATNGKAVTSFPPSVHFGLVVRSPRYFLVNEVEGSTETVAALVPPAGPADSTATIEPFALGNITNRATSPWEFTAAAAFDIGDSAWIGVEGDYALGLTNREAFIDRTPVWNARIGGRLWLSEKLGVGAGVFTDRSPQRTARSYPSFKVDYYGVALGLERRSPLRVAEPGKPDTLVFSTTFGVRYAYGSGQATGPLWDISAAQSIDYVPEGPQVDVAFHEIGLHIGSALEF